jgi:hypothetical protein
VGGDVITSSANLEANTTQKSQKSTTDDNNNNIDDQQQQQQQRANLNSPNEATTTTTKKKMVHTKKSNRRVLRSFLKLIRKNKSNNSSKKFKPKVANSSSSVGLGQLSPRIMSSNSNNHDSAANEWTTTSNNGRKLKKSPSRSTMQRKTSAATTTAAEGEPRKPSDFASAATVSGGNKNKRFKLVKQISTPLVSNKSTKTTGKGTSKYARRFSMLSGNAAAAANRQSTISEANLNLSKSLSSSVYSADLATSSSSDMITPRKSTSQSDSLRRMSRVSSSKELSWYRLEELDYYYKILGLC